MSFAILINGISMTSFNLLLSFALMLFLMPYMLQSWDKHLTSTCLSWLSTQSRTYIDDYLLVGQATVQNAIAFVKILEGYYIAFEAKSESHKVTSIF